jgi:hypothetical protein
VFGLLAATFLVLFLVPALLVIQADFGRVTGWIKAFYFPKAQAD